MTRFIGKNEAQPSVFLGEDTIWLDGASKHDQTKPINVILSPSMYWVKYAELSFKSSSKARLAAKAIFADALPPADYEYLAFRAGEKSFFLFAYDSAKVEQAISKVGINPTVVKKVFFGQALSDQVAKPILCSEKEALVKIEHTAQTIPPILLDTNEKHVSLKSIKFEPSKSNLFFTLKTKKNISLPPLGISVLMTIFSLLVVSLIIDSANLVQSYLAQKKQASDVLKKFDMPQTTLERENIIQKFKKIDKREANIQAIIKSLDSAKFDSGEFVESIELLKDCTIKIKSTRGSFFREKFKELKVISAEQQGSLYVIKLGLE